MDLISLLFQDLSTVRRTQYFFILLLVFITPLLVLIFSRLRKKKDGRTGELKLPPGPKKLPLIGNLHQLGDLPHLSLQKPSNEYGPLMFLRLGFVPTLVVSSADMAKEIFRTHDLVFSGRPILYAAKKLSYGCSDIAFASYGEYWREVRKITILELLSAKRVRSFRAAREEEVAAVIEFVRKSSSSSVPINVGEVMLCLINSVICRVVFGRKYEGGSNGKSKFQRVLQETQDLSAGFCTVDFFPRTSWIHKFDGIDARLEKNYRQMDNFYDKVIDEHLNSSKPNPEVEDLVDVLLQIQKDPGQGIALTRDQIKGILTDIFIAGSDTSAATLVWTMTELIRKP